VQNGTESRPYEIKRKGMEETGDWNDLVNHPVTCSADHDEMKFIAPQVFSLCREI